MALLRSIFETFPGLPLIVLAGLAMYIAGKGLSDALVGGRIDVPGRLALAQWLPIAVLAIAAALTDRPAVAMGLIFSASVACLCLSTGAVAALGLFPATAARQSWTLLLPAALLASLAGFQSAISLPIAGLFAVQGLAALLLWDHRKGDAPIDPLPVTAIHRRIDFRIAQSILAGLLAVVGAWFAIHGLDEVAVGSEPASSGLLTATILSPLLILPMIGTSTDLAQRNRGAMAVDAQMGVALLNVCALLPIVVLVADAKQWLLQRLLPQLLLKLREMQSPWIETRLLPKLHLHPATTVSTAFVSQPFPFPLGVWRVDVVMLIAMGLFLLPVALGRWSLSRRQGLGMMAGYAVYLALSIQFQQYLVHGVPEKIPQ